MSPDKVIDKLSNELSELLQNNNVELIKKYIQYAVVYGLEQRAIFKSKKLLMLDNFGTCIKEFDRLKDAVEYIYELKQYNSKKNTIERQICSVVKGKRNTTYGFHWKYEL